MTSSSSDAAHAAGTARAAKVNKEFVLQKCEFFVDVQVWPYGKLRPEAWLSNFEATELDYAVHLLNAFMYFSNRLVDQLFCAAFQQLGCVIQRSGDSFLSVQASWRAFCDNLLITRVTGEQPSDTDSGFHFARMARDLLSIPQNRIVSPQEAILRLLGDPPRPLIFVDDFVGSGNQFVTTWRRKETILGAGINFATLAASKRGTSFFYMPLVCTETGLRHIRAQCPQVVVLPAHLIPDRYSALASESLLWPEHLRPTASHFLQTASQRAGIPEHQWKGFCGLGLTIAFEHSIPDATLPIFSWKEYGWKPLIVAP